MPKGFSAVVAAAKDINERKNSGGNFVSKRWFRLPNDGDKATVRFLEGGEDVASAWYHQLPPTGNKSFGPFVPCLDQDAESGERIGRDCPGCEQNLKRTFKGVINLIQRDAPVFATDDEGKTDWNKVVGTEDQVVVWQSGVETFEELQIQDETYGLTTRDFVVRRRGTGLNTKYSVNPVDGGATPLSKEDKALAAEKYDLNDITEPPSYEVWGKRNGSSPDAQEDRPVRESPFASKRR